MANAHSSVNYVEPNLTASGYFKDTGGNNINSWKFDDDYERAPRLEDYSIYFNLEVEICSRENISANRTITSDVLIMSYRTKQNDSASTVNFMGGTKVKCGDAKNTSMQYLTTRYADMYVGDLIDYGTTEMIGVKSVDIEYQSSCVPIVTVKFTDVRGLSLFQPTELSRTNSYQGINGINADNVAQSFFQCFFRVPMPRFTMTIKGFYGKPVTYECMCDKFDTQFNSSTGDFDITTRFIGYSYSFLTDVSIDALLAAPYSDYGGGLVGNYNKYWSEKVASGEFQLTNKDKTTTIPMPTLFEVWQKLKHILSDPKPEPTALEQEDSNHEEEISELQEIKDLYIRWYNALFNLCVERYGKDYCYLFKGKGDDGDFYRILILTKSSNNNTLDVDYQQYPSEFKKLNEDLYAAVEKYNAKEGRFRKLDNVSYDFGDYFSLELFNNTYLDRKGNVIFNGFHKNNRLPETDVVNHVFYGVDYYESGATAQEIKEKENYHKRHVLETIYDDGTDQYVKCYAINQDYSCISNRIKALQADANRSAEEKASERKVKEINRMMLDKLGWYPSIKNFTKIMMAHLETLMHLMYTVATNCEGRTASELGVTTGPDGSCIDVNAAKDTIPPFPRVTKNVLGDDGITKIEDTWVGEYNRGSIPFEEVDFIDGFFNAIEKLKALKDDTEKTLAENEKQVGDSEEVFGGLIKHPVSMFDFYITKSPYGDSNEISNDIKLYNFAGRVCIRMFNILSIGKIGGTKRGDDYIRNVAMTEADNFFENVKISNENFLSMLRNENIISSEKIMEIVTQANPNNECPWGDRRLFSINGDTVRLDGYSSAYNNVPNWVYPIQGVSFPELEKIDASFRCGKVNENQLSDISLYTLSANWNDKLWSNNGCGTILITNDVDFPNKMLVNANNDVYSGYTDLYNELTQSSEFDKGSYTKWFEVKGIPSICRKITQLENKNIGTFKLPDAKGAMTVSDGSNDYQYIFDNDSAIADNPSLYTLTELFEVSGGTYNDERAFLHMKNKSDVAYNNGMTFGSFSDNSPRISRAAIGLLSIKTNDEYFKGLTTIREKQFIYMPKICLLQLAALCFATGDPNRDFSGFQEIYNAINSNLKVRICDNAYKSSFANRVGAVLEMSKQVRLRLARYFYNWYKTTDVGKQFSNRLHLDSGSDKIYLTSQGETNRTLLDQNDKYVKELTNDLLTPMLLIKLSVNFKKGVTMRDAGLSFSSGQADIYLNAFIDRLKQRYEINYKEDESGQLIKTTDEPHHTSDDMKAELYRYMKQLYDKWIPMTSFDDWTMDKFFLEGKAGEETGHKFYFIDSYYNDISDKLLINPRNLMERIDTLLDNGDVNAMMLGFMADIYAYNKCMMKCIQNFFDLTREGSMNEMFVPMSFNSIDWKNEVNKFSSFVVVYPYEPSRNLNIPNNEYNDDGFMLNDENETPKAIRTKSDADGLYKIPAFGVAYGKQYQSYFKSVHVNMQSPVATQQAIQAKHYILQQAANVKSVGITGQDLYDVYSTQSYTCDVEMMGCAWVQPMMYFVLLNIPMFRGSYLIMKVRHSIKPGDMTTTFTGCRMANVSNKLVEEIFTDDGYLSDNEGSGSYQSDRYLKASIDNDCPYKIYPLWESEDVELTKDELENASKAMSILINTYGFTKEAAAGMCGNIYKESTWNLYALNSIGAFGLCQWLGDRKRLLIKKYGKNPSFAQQLEYVNYEWDNECVAKGHRKELMNQKTPESAAYIVRKYFERPGEGEADDSTRKSKARKYYDNCNSNSKVSTSKPSNKDPNDKKDVIQAFYDAINRSAQDTPSIGVSLKSKAVNANGKIYLVLNCEGGNEKLGYVFDMILNSEYYAYVEELGWIYPNGGLESDVKPSSIYCLVKENVEANKKNVWITKEGNNVGTQVPNDLPDGNPTLLRCLAKRAKTVGNVNSFKKEVPQMKDEKILDKYKPKDCDSLFSSGGGSSGGYNVGGGSRKETIKKLGFSDNPTKEECNGKMATIKVKCADGLKSLTIHEDLQEEVKNIYDEIYASGFKVKTTCGYCFRTINNPSQPKSKTLSMHSFGCAIDINPSDNPFVSKGRPQSSGDSNVKIRTNDSAIVKIFAKYGWGWGGRYGDYMHFSKANGA